MRLSLRLRIRYASRAWRRWLPLLFLLAAPFLLATQALAAPPRAELLPGANEGDWLLIIEADGERSSDELNLEPLLHQFAIGRLTMSRVHTSVRKLTRWQIPLHLVASDANQVPALTLGAESTPALPLPERDQPGTKDAAAPRFSPIELQASVLHQGPLYPGQPFIYRLNLWLPANMEAPNLSEPVGDGFIIRRLGNDQWESPANPDMPGRLTRQWLLQAKGAGLHLLGSPHFQGRLSQGSGLSERLSAKAATLSVKVDQAPLEPVASELTLSQQLSPATGAKAGEPVIRTLTLVMEGGDGNRLTLPKLTLPAGLQARPDGEQQHEQFIAKGVLRFERQWRQALIANETGDYLLPAIDLPWFNTLSGRIEHARLPALTLRFEADTATSPDNRSADGESLYWVLGALLLRALWWRGPRWRAFHRLQHALAAGEPNAVRLALLAWARRRWGTSYHHLADLPCQRDAAVGVLLDDLDRACFASDLPANRRACWPTLAGTLCSHETFAIAFSLRKLAQLSH